MQKEFGGGYYIAILELFRGLDNKEYHGKELFELFEEKYGSGSYINFLKGLRHLIDEKKVKRSKPKAYNRRYYSLILK